MEHKQQTKQVGLRIDKKIYKIYDNLSPLSTSDAIRQAVEQAILTPEWIDAQIEVYKGLIRKLEALREASPFYEGYVFSEEENEWFRGHYDTAVKKNNSEIIKNKVYRGYNLLTEKNLTNSQYKRVLAKWLTENKLTLPESDESGDTDKS